jgi:hypothetical protein
LASGACKEILTGIATAIPALKAPLAKALTGANAVASAGATPTVATVLQQVPSTLELLPTTPVATAGGASALADPTYGAPYVPLPGSHVNLDPGSGTDVPTGGRNYASP